MSLAVISTAFTGHIAVAFDRRYGALKRIGATALPVWGIIAGKSWPSSPWFFFSQLCWAASALPWGGGRTSWH